MKAYGVRRSAWSPCPCCIDRGILDRKVKTRKKQARQLNKKEIDKNVQEHSA